MRKRRAGSGQVLPMVALLMVVILGMAALAVDGSNIYSQHRRFQADLDVAVKSGAALINPSVSEAAYTSTAQTAIQVTAGILSQNGFPNQLTTMTPRTAGGGWCGTYTIDGNTIAGIKICTPAESGSFAGRFDTMEAVMTENVHAFFGKVLGLGFLRISVRAVSEHGGFNTQPFTMIGLDTTSGECSVRVQGTTNTHLETDGSIYANSQTCIKQANESISGYSDSHQATDGSNGNPITGTIGTTNGLAPIIANPYTVTVPTPYGKAITVCSSATDSCDHTGLAWLGSGCYSKWTVPITPTVGVKYWLPENTAGSVSNTSAITGFSSSPSQDVFLPHCDTLPTTGDQTGGIYYFTDTSSSGQDIKTSSSASITSINSAFVVDQSVKTLIQSSGNATWNLDAPSNGPLQNMAIWENEPCTVSQSLTINGSSSSVITGIIDAACADITLSGNSASTPFISGAVVGWTITVAGSSTTIIDYPTSASARNHGSVLVE